MIIRLKNFAFLIILFLSIDVYGQSNTTSPYSAFGLGLLRGDQLPQFRAMGGISTGVRTLGGYSNINVANPASYSAIRLTTFDVGLYANRSILQRNGQEEASGNFALNHINFAMPVTRTSAFSFGLMPFSDMGYNFSTPTSIDTTSASTVYSGEGGLHKAYLGYGVQLGSHFSVGANVSYLFGRLSNIGGIILTDDPSALSTRIENKRDINGLSYDFGAQFHTNLGPQTLLTIGYTNNIGSPLNSTASDVVTRRSPSGALADTISFIEDNDYSITMPMRQRLGFSVNKANKWLVGADVHYDHWADYRDREETAPFNNSYGFALGGQWTPNINSIRYLSVVDYRLGLRYDKSYLNLNNTDINDRAISFGVGLPIAAKAGITSFYKINLTAEIGQRGSLANNLVRENYFNFNLSFLLNDRWFTRFRYD